MSLTRTRRVGAPLSVAMLVCFFATLLPPRPARADALAPVTSGTGGPATLTTPPPAANTPQALATVNFSTGAAQSSFPFKLPTARGEAQPSLGLVYSSASGVGFAGVGWTLSVPSIVRQAGLGSVAQYQDRVLQASIPLAGNVGAAFDEYMADGARLIPICAVQGTACAGGGVDTFPSFLDSYVYFRRETDDGLRYFLSPDGRTWRVQSKSGHELQYGHALDSVFVNGDGLEMPDPTTLFPNQSNLPKGPGAGVHRWNLVRDSDASGNTVYYVYDTQASLLAPTTTSIEYRNPGIAFLTDIYDTVQLSQTPQAATFAHHVHLTWQRPAGEILSEPPITVWDPIWRAIPFAELARVDVTSAGWTSTTRTILRSYVLSYTTNNWGTRQYLSKVQVRGRCSTDLTQNTTEPTAYTSKNCPALTSTSYSYANVPNSPPAQPVLPSIVAKLPAAGVAGGTYNAGITPTAGLLDLNGDGAADFISGPYPASATGNNLLYEIALNPTSSPATTHLVPDPTNPAGLKATFASMAPGSPNVIYGDWMRNGEPNWLWLGPLNPSTGIASAELYSVTQGTSGTRLLTFNQSVSFLGAGFASGRALDIDGDGTTDMTLVPTTPTGDYFTNFSGHDRQGHTFAFSANTQKSCATIYMDPGNYGSDAFRTFSDIDGDGLAELVIMYANPAYNLVFLTNRGDGRFGISGSSPCNQSAGGRFTRSEIDFRGSSPSFKYRLDQSLVRFGDINGDHLPDLAILSPDQLLVCFRGAYEQLNTPILPVLPLRCLAQSAQALGAPAGKVLDLNQSHLAIADIDGTGVGKVLYSTQYGGPTSLSFVPTGQEGLLTSITTAEGATTGISYATAQSRGLSIPAATWLVTTVSTGNGLGSTPSFDGLTVRYEYANPIYDLRDRQFVGFASVTETHLGDAGPGSPDLVRKTTFATQTGPAGGSDYGFYRASRGLPAIVEEMSATGTHLRTTVNQFADGATIAGVDGRAFNHIWLNKQYTYLWDPLQPTGTQQNVRVMRLNGVGGAITLFRQSAILPNSTPIVSEVDHDLGIAGNETDEIDYGAGDTPIHTNLQWQLQGSSGWSYRVTQARTYYGSGTGATSGTVREYDYFYDGQARLTDVKAPLSGTLELPGPSGQARAAGRPSEQSRDGTILLKHIDYDGKGYGLVRRVQGPNGQCVSTNYDVKYFHLPINSIVYTNGCGQGGLTTSFVFDRGIERVTTKIAPDGGATTVKYDVFGRVIETDQPAFQPGMSAAAAAVRVDYLDQAPIRRIHVSTVDGPAGATVDRQHYRYIDSFGETLASLDEAGAADASQGPVWTVSGAHVHYSGGRLHTIYKPLTMTAFDPGDPSKLTSYAYSGPTESFRYDELGRVLSSLDFNGNKSKRIYQPAKLSVSLFDADQQPGGRHGGSYTTVTLDGHGRVAQTDKHLANGPQGSGDLVTTLQYQATGEPTVVTQSYPGGFTTRWMQYDSLGRRVVNAEPNTSQSFSATPGASGVVGWTYAYNDSGRLVGTSDARGCGENIFHDGAGRTVAEDYSPCDQSQLAYSAPDLQSGDGTEAFYVYDGVSGRVTDEYDRAQHSNYQYDARDEVTRVQRRITTPFGDPTLNQRYDTHVFTRSVSLYSESHRPLTETTGADVTELLGTGTGGSGRLQIGYTRDGRVQSIGGDYGTILSSAKYDAAGRIFQQVLGDRAFTTIDLAYNNDETLKSYSVQRATGPWLAPSGTYTPPPSGDPTLIGTLTSSSIQYEKSGSIASITDTANASQWPSGLKPSTRTFSYYDDYRLKDAATSYAGGDDPFNYTPFAPELALGNNTQYPPVSPEPNRVRDQSYSYDWLGNTTAAGSNNADDNLDFPDRSLGSPIVYGSSTAGPNQLQAAESSNGFLQTFYDAAGNVTEIDVSAGASTWSYKYTWDELGRMSTAIRNDSTGTSVAYQQFQYDAHGQRVSNYYYDANQQAQLSDLQVFSSLVVRHTDFVGAGSDYQIDSSNEHIYVDAGGTLAHVYRAPPRSGFPNVGPTGSTLVALALGDPTGSPGFVIDRDTSELIERPTYVAYGTDESDYRPDRWANFREKIRYTGHEDDAEVGLVYFGARYYSTLLQRWVSPDPLTIHGLGADPNPYAYVGGSPIGHIDPFGLDCIGAECGAASNGTDAGVAGDAAVGPPNVNWAKTGQAVDDFFHNLSCIFGCGGGQSAPPPPIDNSALIFSAPPGHPAFVGPVTPSQQAQYDLLDQQLEARLRAEKAQFPAEMRIGIIPVFGPGGLPSLLETIEGFEASSAANATLLRNQLMAEEIAGGHAFDKHVLQQGEFPGIATRAEFASEIENFLNSPGTIMRNLSNGRTAYWNDATGTVLIRNPAAADGGTFLSPTDGIGYFWRLQ